MKFGIFLPMSGALARIDNVIRASQAAESLGYDSVWVYDMSLTQTRDNYRNNLVCGSWEDIDPDGDPNFVEPFTTMSAIAAVTSTIEIGSAVIQLPLYNPIVVARQAANIDVLSRGRLRLGVGIGSRINFFREGYDRLHFPFRKRGYIFDEYLRAIRQLWESKSPSSFAGKYIQFSDLELYPKPISPKIFIGSGVADKGLRRVMEFGDGVIFPYRSPQEIKANVQKIKEAALKRGSDPSKIEIAQTVFTSMGRTSEEARAQLTATIEVHAKGFGSKAMSTDELSRHEGRTVTTDHLMQMSLVGTAKEIVKGIETFREAGLQHPILAMIFRGKDSTALIDNLKPFAKDIMPSFK
ncbi:MAG: LLM class flavin-dependent oxidoreductase [Rhabdochlamydiaceae bacterium]